MSGYALMIGGSTLRMRFEIGLVLLLEERVLSGESRFDGYRLRLGRRACGDGAARGKDPR
jgi:hypothetical protein